MLYILLIAVCLLPIYLTGVNIYNLFAKKQFKRKATDIMIFTLGPVFTFLLYNIWSPPSLNETYQEWYGVSFYEPVSNFPVILSFAAIAILGYAVLRIKKTSLPPLVVVLCMSAMFIGSALSIFWILQLSPHIFIWYSFAPIEGILMCLFPLNFIISTALLTREVVKQAAEAAEKRVYKSRFMQWCGSMLSKSVAYPVAAFVFMWPLLGLITAVLVLFGQQPDAAIRAFTDTSDWLFSQHVVPPVPHGAEYFCTVATGGHTRVVKPLRMGIRGGQRIVVNRQLCVMNAFEELLQQKTPHFQRLLRRCYDAVGCPVAKRIKTPVFADIAYIVMKPAEWLATLSLYLFTMDPESRVSRQYLPLDTRAI